MDTYTTQSKEREYYHYGFQELCREEGEKLALNKVAMYQQLAAQYKDSPSFVIRNCRLLTTHRDPSHEQDPKSASEPTPLDRYCSVFYAPVTNTTSQKPLTLRQVAELIRSGRFKPQTDHLRTIPNKKANRQYKATAFAYATFSGTFTARADANLVQHSGLICIDLDNLNDRLEEVRGIVNADAWTVMSFTSPNGDGLKVIYETEPSLSQEANYKAFSNRLRKLCRLEPTQVDKSCKDVSRACFLPHDAALFVNPHLERA